MPEGKDLEMAGQGCLEMDAVRNNYQMQTKTLFRNVCFL